MWRNRRLLVLCYHSVTLGDEAEWNGGLYCTRSFLRRRFELLRELDVTVLPLREALKRLRNATLPPRSAVLTFDDGTVDFPHIVVPLLREFQYPATLYPSTYYCDRNQPIWTVALRYLLWRGRSLGSIDLSDVIPTADTLQISTHAARLAAEEELAISVADWDTDSKHELVAAVARKVDVDFDELIAKRQFQLMSSEEMTGLPHDTVMVELHTHRHRTPDDRLLFEREIEENRRFITERRGIVPQHFCYPSGKYRTNHFDWLPKLNILSATTCTPALATANTNPYLVPRFVDTVSVTEDVFRAWVSGVAALAPKRPSTGASGMLEHRA